MLEFKSPEIADKKTADKLFSMSKNRSFENCFGTVYLWQRAYDLRIAFCDNMVFTGAFHSGCSFLIPSGIGDIPASIDKLFEYAHAKGEKLSFYSVSEEEKNFLEASYPNVFTFEEDRETADYIYTAESLSELKGKKLASKRNHINRFIEQFPDMSYEPITPSNIGEVYDMHEEWCKAADYEKDGLSEESDMVRCAIESFKQLELVGGAIRGKGKILAFSIGEPLSSDTFLVHIEKAYHDVNGAYPMINREFVRNACKGYLYINREDDNGVEGLRRAKLSYRPCEILKKYYASEI